MRRSPSRACGDRLGDLVGPQAPKGFPAELAGSCAGLGLGSAGTRPRRGRRASGPRDSGVPSWAPGRRSTTWTQVTARSARTDVRLVDGPGQLGRERRTGPRAAGGGARWSAPDLGRRHGDAQLGGDGLVGQVVHVAQDHHGPRASGRRARPGPASRRSREGGRCSAAESSGFPTGASSPLGDHRRPARRRARRGGGREAWRPPRRRGGAVGRDAVEPGGELGVAPEALEAPIGPPGTSPGATSPGIFLGSPVRR